MTRSLPLFLVALLSLTLSVACGDDDDSSGSAGASGSAGTGGSTNASCCTSSSQCGDDQCIGGSCTKVAAGECFADTDCTDGTTCQGATVCPCGQECVAPTKAGTCALAGCPATVADAGDSCTKDGLRCGYAGADGCPVTLLCASNLDTSRWLSVAPKTGDACTTAGQVCTYSESFGDSPTVHKTAMCGNSLWSVTEKYECTSESCVGDCQCPTGKTCQDSKCQ